MTTTTTSSSGLTSYSRFVLFGLVLPLLFIAGVQLFILSGQTATYFAWTFASPLAAAFMGAGYWSAMFHAYSGVRAKGWEYVRSSMPAALTATSTPLRAKPARIRRADSSGSIGSRTARPCAPLDD